MLKLDVSPQITLRLLEGRHANSLFALTDANREHLREWLPWLDSVSSARDTKAFIRQTLKQYAANQGFQTGIWYSSELVGLIGFLSIDWQNFSTAIGYWLAHNFEGRGIMTECCRALVDYAFNEWKLKRIEIRCAVENHKSRAIPERLGFRKEGIARSAELLYGKFVDLVIYAILSDEWKAGQIRSR